MLKVGHGHRHPRCAGEVDISRGSHSEARALPKLTQQWSCDSMLHGHMQKTRVQASLGVWLRGYEPRHLTLWRPVPAAQRHAGAEQRHKKGSRGARSPCLQGLSKEKRLQAVMVGMYLCHASETLSQKGPPKNIDCQQNKTKHPEPGTGNLFDLLVRRV